ncbi:hypothetical protein SKAU_G00306410 [Synaphobranchus kaupii]|uniref:Uncharacterized protein n=1 Tax=Synaphobranchus kaupii TaxID=118154 RepID=A0A9Q1EQU8_SYNKA|nr:hypothetical protein SKAU_G00306410 [Synaphobranchus kaupii]
MQPAVKSEMLWLELNSTLLAVVMLRNDSGSVGLFPIGLRALVTMVISQRSLLLPSPILSNRRSSSALFRRIQRPSTPRSSSDPLKPEPWAQSLGQMSREISIHEPPCQGGGGGSGIRRYIITKLLEQGRRRPSAGIVHRPPFRSSGWEETHPPAMCYFRLKQKST